MHRTSPKRRAIVHIGNVKTGTSAIQLLLRRMRKPLAARGFVLPGPGAHHAIWTQLTAPSAHSADVDARIRADIAAAPADAVLLLSSENFVNFSPEKLREVLDGLGIGEVKILAWLRPEATTLAALYLQYLKSGRWLGPLSAHLQILQDNAIRLPEHLQSLADFFGPENIVAREYHREALKDGSLVAEFWDAAGLPPDMVAHAMRHDTATNLTLSAEVSQVMHALCHVMVADFSAEERALLAEKGHEAVQLRVSLGPLRRALEARMDRLGGTTYRLPLYLQEALADRFQAERADFAARWFDRPPTSHWLADKIAPPQPLVDLPYAPLAEALAEAEPEMVELGFPKRAQSLAAFARALPRAGDRLISRDIEAAFGLESEAQTPPPDLYDHLRPRVRPALTEA